MAQFERPKTLNETMQYCKNLAPLQSYGLVRVMARRSTLCAILACCTSTLPVANIAHAQTSHSAAQNVDATAPVVLPIHQTVLPDGQIRYSVTLSIANAASVDTMLDTGSVGLRVLTFSGKGATSIPATTGDLDAPASHHGFSSGISLNGVDTNSVVDIAGHTGSVPLQLVTSVSCLPTHPQCPAIRIAETDYKIGGNGFPGAGFDAILGIGITRANGSDLPNPLKTLGYRNWVVKLPLPGASAPGSLTLYTHPASLPTFTSVSADELGRLQGCVTDLAQNQMICGAVLLDTGVFGIGIHSPDIGTPRAWRPGTPSALSLAHDGTLSFDFVSGALGSSSFVAMQPLEGRPQSIIASGALPYFYFLTLYDDNGRIVALKAR